MKVKAVLTEEMLGMTCNDPDVFAKFQASRAKDAAKSADEQKVLEKTLAADAGAEQVSVEEFIARSLTVFPRNADGRPILYDYQLKGFFKEQFKIIFALGSGVKIGTATLSKWTCAQMVDNHVHVTPRMIELVLPAGATAVTQQTCTRPLRVVTPKGDRVAMACSETVPAGTTLEFTVVTDHPSLDGYVVRALENGARKGFGGWRNSGKGRFEFRFVDSEL